MPDPPPSPRLAELLRRRRDVAADPQVAAWVERTLRRRGLLQEGRGVALDLPDLGHRSLLLLARARDGGPLDARGRPIAGVVVRLHPKLARFARYLAAVAGVERRGLPVPALLGVAPARGRALPGRWASLEELVEGRAYNHVAEDERPAAAARVGAALAAFHGHRRRRPGWLWLPRPGSAAGACLSDVRRRLARLAPHLPGDAAPRLRREFERAAGALRGRREYELLHGHVFANNFLVRDDGVTVVDLGSARFGDAGEDLVGALSRLARARADVRAALRAGYFGAGTGLDPDEFARQEPFYLAAHRLSALVGLLRRMETGRLGREAFAAALAEGVEHVRRPLAS